MMRPKTSNTVLLALLCLAIFISLVIQGEIQTARLFDSPIPRQPTPTPTPGKIATPSPNLALTRDAEAYMDMVGTDLDEAIRRLSLQNDIGELRNDEQLS